MGQTSSGSDIRFEAGASPKARYTSGLSIYDEALIGGRWVGRYWAGTGFVEPERNLTWLSGEVENPPGGRSRLGGLDAGSFGLVLNGQSLHFGWSVTSMREGDASRGRRYAVVELTSSLVSVRVQVHTLVDGSGIFERWLSIENVGEEDLAVGEAWPWTGLLFRPSCAAHIEMDRTHETLVRPDEPAFSVGHMSERIWGNEGAFRWLPLPSTPLRLESRTGRSGHNAPFFVVRDELTGEHVVGGLAWSGNWSIELNAETNSTRDPMLGFRIGPTSPAPQRVIAPGEIVDTPHTHLGRLQLDFDGTIQAWHRHLRESVLLEEIPGREGLVILNHWGYVAHELTEERLLHEIDVAVEIGAEVFVVDAGWFGDKGGAWWTTVGDWECGDRLPNGLEPVFKYARERGLLYGLWFDLERFGPESKVAKQHPEWLLKRFGRSTAGGDIDLTNPDALSYVERKLCEAIERYDLDLFRLDYNTSPVEGGQTTRGKYEENTLWRYYECVYALYDRVRTRYPKLIMENCAGGGGRTDLGMVSRFHHTWVTDWQIAPRTLSILNGMTMALPPERVDRNGGVGQDAHLRGDLDFHLRSCMFGHMTLTGIVAGPDEANLAQLARVRHHVRIYKEFIRPFIASCNVYHHTPELPGKDPRDFAVLEYVAADQRRAIAGIFRLAGPGRSDYHLKLRGVDAGTRYKITLDSSGEAFIMSGNDLRQSGLHARLARPLTSELVLIEALPDGSR